MNELALFAGAGGGLLGSKLLGWRTICAVEIDPYCQEVLLRRQEEKHLEAFPIWDDIRTFDGTIWRGKVDIVTGGFPCQPFSCAGKRKGVDDERGGAIWDHTIRIIREVGANECFLENVPALRCAHGKGSEKKASHFGRVLSDLAEIGYDVQWFCLSAAECGAPHKRDRIWFKCKMAITESKRVERLRTIREQKPNTSTKEMLSGCNRTRGRINWWDQDPAEDKGERRKTQPRLGRVADGVAYRMDQLKALGNGQVPEVVKRAFRTGIKI